MERTRQTNMSEEIQQELPRFTMKDENFICEVCRKQVNKLGYTARDHCPYCLCSKHVDHFPGDRSCSCHGILRPVAIDPGKKGTYKIVYQCEKCGMIKRNKTAKDDNMDLIVQIMSHPIEINRA